MNETEHLLSSEKNENRLLESSAKIKVRLSTEQRSVRRLKEIHKLKRKNLVLSDKRYSCYVKLRKQDPTTYGYLLLILEIMKISECIGSNGNKIQRLRTMIKQEMSF